jgi:class 3 adenylate cyclase
MTIADPNMIDWLAGLFPVVPARGKPATVLFTDIEGFTAHAAAGGDRTAMRLLRAHDAAVLPPVRRHMGRVLKRLGDGMMVLFPSPWDALAAALAMQRAARVKLRIGIHTGPVRTRAGDLIGHAVNVASRVTDRARGGEILVSASVREGASGLAVRFRRARPLAVAGAAPVALFTVASEAPAAARALKNGMAQAARDDPAARGARKPRGVGRFAHPKREEEDG